MFENFLSKVENQEKKVIAIDFDGVIHKNSRGFYDGTVYDEPIEGSLEALRYLSKIYTIVIFSCKALPDRPIVNGMNGIEHIKEWLKSHKVLECVKEVTYYKPRASIYIDDKGYRFENWKDSLDFIRSFEN